MSFSLPLKAAPQAARNFFTPPTVTATGGAAAWFAAQRTDDVAGATADADGWSDGAGRGDVDHDVANGAGTDALASPIEALDGRLGRLDSDADVRTDAAADRARTGDALFDRSRVNA